MTPYPYELATDEQKRLGSPWWCIHHRVMLEPLTEPVENRVAWVRQRKAEHEIEPRLRAMRPVRGVLPEAVVMAHAAYQQAYAAYQQAYAAYQQAYAAYKQAYAARQQAEAAWQQAYAARQQAEAAWQQAYAARRQAYAALRQAFRDHAPAIESLFRQECPDVAWGPDGLIFEEPPRA